MKTIRGTVDFSQDDPTMRISIKEMFMIIKKYPIGDLFKKKQAENPEMNYNEVMHEVIMDCYEDFKTKKK